MRERAGRRSRLGRGRSWAALEIPTPSDLIALTYVSGETGRTEERATTFVTVTARPGVWAKQVGVRCSPLAAQDLSFEAVSQS